MDGRARERALCGRNAQTKAATAGFPEPYTRYFLTLKLLWRDQS